METILIQFAENGNIRKWDAKPFEGGIEYSTCWLRTIFCTTRSTFLKMWRLESTAQRKRGTG